MIKVKSKIYEIADITGVTVRNKGKIILKNVKPFVAKKGNFKDSEDDFYLVFLRTYSLVEARMTCISS